MLAQSPMQRSAFVTIQWLGTGACRLTGQLRTSIAIFPHRKGDRTIDSMISYHGQSNRPLSTPKPHSYCLPYGGFVVVALLECEI